MRQAYNEEEVDILKYGQGRSILKGLYNKCWGDPNRAQGKNKKEEHIW